MDPEKMGKWLETAKQFTNGNFWADLFGEEAAVQSSGPVPAMKRQPAVDVYQTRDSYHVLIDLPGLRKEDVELSASGECLYVKGEAKPALEGATALSRERLTGPFERAIMLPEKIDQAFAHITARFQGGVLDIRIPRSVLPRKSIEIK